MLGGVLVGVDALAGGVSVAVAGDGELVADAPCRFEIISADLFEHSVWVEVEF